MSKNICILPILRHHTHSFVKKLKKIPICQFCLFFHCFIKNAKFKKKWLSKPQKMAFMHHKAWNNGFTNSNGEAINLLNGKIDNIYEVANSYKKSNINWIAVADENYGEGSSREHAAMEPRFRGCKVVLVKSFARIHEANLKKQGILPLTFENKDDYDLIEQEDKITIENLEAIAPDASINIRIEKTDGETKDIKANHSLSDEQIEWFKAGSALNSI